MDANSPTPERIFLDNLRRRRAELLESMRAVEQALSAPAPGREAAWAERVYAALIELSGDFREHIKITEGADGLYDELERTAPRLSGAVARLTREHEQILELLDGALGRTSDRDASADVHAVRELSTTLLARLLRHRQHGSDLVFEAYQTDIGGET